MNSRERGLRENTRQHSVYLKSTMKGLISLKERTLVWRVTVWRVQAQTIFLFWRQKLAFSWSDGEECRLGKPYGAEPAGAQTAAYTLLR